MENSQSKKTWTKKKSQKEVRPEDYDSEKEVYAAPQPKYQSGTNLGPIWYKLFGHKRNLPTLFLAQSRAATLTAEKSRVPDPAEWEQVHWDPIHLKGHQIQPDEKVMGLHMPVKMKDL